ncbi:MAG: hypothetical protein R3C02_07495 [Planctomycetaceae bacterium]
MNITIVNRFNTDPYFFFEPANYNTGYGYNGPLATWHADMDSNHELFNYGRLFPDLEAGDTIPPRWHLPAGLSGLPDSVQFRSPVTDLVFTNNNVNNNGSVVADAQPGRDPYSTLGGFVMRVGSTLRTSQWSRRSSSFPKGLIQLFSIALPTIEPSVCRFGAGRGCSGTR